MSQREADVFSIFITKELIHKQSTSIFLFEKHLTLTKAHNMDFKLTMGPPV